MDGLAAALIGLEGIELHRDKDLRSLTTLRIGGAAECLLAVHSEAALEAALREIKARDLPLHLLGMGSNVLFPRRMPGVVVRLCGEFRTFRIEGTTVFAGAAMPLAQLAQRTLEKGLLGLEALAGFPSSVGGAVYMNAGCYGTEVADVLRQATVIWPSGGRRQLPVAELEPGYRSTVLQGTQAIVTQATFDLYEGDAKAAKERMRELNARRWSSLPSGKPTAGSVFKNPAGDHAGRLIESVGLKGTAEGGAAISDRHANVIVNEGGATAEDVLGLMERAYRLVLEHFGVALEPELVLAGSLAQRWKEMAIRR